MMKYFPMMAAISVVAFWMILILGCQTKSNEFEEANHIVDRIEAKLDMIVQPIDIYCRRNRKFDEAAFKAVNKEFQNPRRKYRFAEIHGVCCGDVLKLLTRDLHNNISVFGGTIDAGC